MITRKVRFKTLELEKDFLMRERTVDKTKDRPRIFYVSTTGHKILQETWYVIYNDKDCMVKIGHELGSNLSEIGDIPTKYLKALNELIYEKSQI